jgi:hypothetical protein
MQNEVCPSEEFTNCQDVTASIGIYLSAVPIGEEDSNNNHSGSYNGLISKNREGARLVDPSTMTEELLAFQESFADAIANNELQEAILEEYREKQHYDISPTVVIVTDTINNVHVSIDTGSDSDDYNSSDITDGLITSDNNSIGNDDKNATGSGDFFDTAGQTSSDVTIDISWGEPTHTTSPIAASEEADGLRKVGLATGGVIGTVLISLFFVSFLVVGISRKRRSDDLGGDRTIEKVQGKINKDRVDCDDFDQSGQKLASYVADKEDGFTGRTMRTVASESTHTTTSTHESLVQVVATSSSSYSLGNNVDAETTTCSSSKKSRNACEDKILPPTEKAHGERMIIGDPIAKAVVYNNDLTSLNNDGHNHSNTMHVEASADAYNGKYDEDDNENDFVLGEDDDSDSSVGQHLLSASKLQNLKNQNLDPITSPQTSRSSTFTNEVASLETGKESVNSDNTFSSGSEDVSGSLQKPSQVPSSQSPLCTTETVEDISPFSELDVAIANCDWVTVGATAAVIASTSSSSKRPPTSRSTTLQFSSSSSVGTSDFSQKAEELDRLIEAGEWQAVVVTAAKYDVEGVTIEEDASRSCRSRTSTQGSDTNDSYTSIMDTSSEGRNTSVGRSVTTSASQKERAQEIRTQVAQLVRDVVPDEEENVDEMMIQFKGREEDLLESLRTMKERMVARKARVESQKFARKEARSRHKKEGLEIHNDSNVGASITTDGSEKLNMNEVYSAIKKVGSFDNSTRVDHDKAAAAAAAWAIQRSLDEMMEKNREAPL